MLVLKSCPHCHGDLALDADRRAAFLSCVQCGHILSRGEERALGVRVCRHGIVHVRQTARTSAQYGSAPVHA